MDSQANSETGQSKGVCMAPGPKVGSEARSPRVFFLAVSFLRLQDGDTWVGAVPGQMGRVWVWAQRRAVCCD